jgi:hypothetical protein
MFKNPSSTSYSITPLSSGQFTYYAGEGPWTEHPCLERGALSKVAPPYKMTTIWTRSTHQETPHSKDLLMDFMPIQFNQANRPPDLVLNSDP